MNEDVIEDLKQFITTTVSQQTSELTNELTIELTGVITEKIDGLETRLTHKIDTLSDSVATALSDSNEETDKQLKNHETRITKLETKVV